MNFDQFAATFQNPEQDPCRDLAQPEPQVGEVVVAGRVVTATKESCCLNINGAMYEVAAVDVIDIQVLTPDTAERADEKKDVKQPEASAKRAAEKTPPKDVAPGDPARVVLIRLKASAPMWRRIPVQAALVAAVGTWVSVLPVPTAA